MKLSTEDRREQIVMTALKIIAEQGVRNLTTASLAGAAGMSEANIYRHFSGKDEIISETVSYIGEGLRTNLAAVLHGEQGGDPAKKLKRAFMMHVNYVGKNEGIPRLVFSEEIHGGDRKLKQRLLESIDSYASRLESLIKEAQNAGSVKRELNPKSTAMMFIGMVQATVLRWSLSGFSFPLATEGRKLWDNFEKCVRE